MYIRISSPEDRETDSGKTLEEIQKMLNLDSESLECIANTPLEEYEPSFLFCIEILTLFHIKKEIFNSFVSSVAVPFRSGQKHRNGTF